MQLMKQNEQESTKSMLLQCVVLYMCICAGLWISKYFLLVAAGITIAVSLFGRLESSFYHLFFCLPFAMIYKLSPESTSLFTYVMLGVGVILIYRVHKIGATQLLLIMLFMLYALCGMGNNITTVTKMIMGMMLFYIFVRNIHPENFKNQIWAFLLGMVGSSAIGVLKGNWARLDAYYSEIKTVYISSGKVLRFTGLYLDPNYYSVSVIFALMLCLMLFASKKGNRVVLGIIIGALSIFGLLSYSKMFLITFLVVVLIFILRELQSPKKIALAMIVCMAGGGALYTWMQNNDYFIVMAKRFFKGDVTTGRVDIWTAYIRHIDESLLTLLFGDGLGMEYLTVGGPHNTILELIFFFGLIGGILFCITMASIFKSKVYKNKRNIFNYALPILFFFMSSTLGCLTINELMFYCMLMWIGLNYDFED